LKAKAEKNRAVNESLKIVINGSFGKFGSKWSCLYSPDLMAQVTMTGQLSFLMLIERLHLKGIQTVSANTDGIVTKIPRELESVAEEVVREWEFDTDYEMESTDYLSINSRDINTYIAFKEGGAKGKGVYADKRDPFYILRSNPSNDICVDAVKSFIQTKASMEKTIRECDDITKFLTVRTVNGNAVKNDVEIGKAIRWYYGSEELDAIYYANNGNMVSKSAGGVPLMQLPETFPKDVDYEWYITEAYRILKDIGYKTLRK